jgi:hypothetical protein
MCDVAQSVRAKSLSLFSLYYSSTRREKQHVYPLTEPASCADLDFVSRAAQIVAATRRCAEFCHLPLIAGCYPEEFESRIKDELDTWGKVIAQQVLRRSVHFQKETLMKCSILAVPMAAAMSWAGIWPAVSAENPVVGTWQVTSISAIVLDTKETIRPFGDHPTGYIQYSPGGHMVVFLTAGELKPPASGSYTDAERADVHRAIAGGYAGTYAVEGNKVIHHILTAWRPEWIAGDQIRYFEINGKNLTIKTVPIKSQLTGKDVVSTLTFERVE